jgi:DNA-binding MarR family transcriptional regulator
MSLKALTWALEQQLFDQLKDGRRRAQQAAKLVLLALANHHNESTNECFPSKRKLMEASLLSEKTLDRTMKWLEERNWIKRIYRFKNKRQTSNSYTLNFERKEGVHDDPPQDEGALTSCASHPTDTMSVPTSLNHKNEPSAPARAIDKSPPVKEVDWRNRLANYRRRAIWPAAKWGPPMHTPGCLVPPDLVRLWDDTQGKAFAEEAAPPAYQSRKPQKAWRRAGASIN